MLLDDILDEYPKEAQLKEGFSMKVRPLEKDDEMAFHEFFLALPERERMFIKHRVTDPSVIRDWCERIDLGHKLPLLGLHEGQVAGCCTLHQQLGGWKRHVGRVSVLVHPKFRGKGIAKWLVNEMMDVAQQIGLEKLEAEFLADQKAAVKVFGLLGFSQLLLLPDYVKDMQAIRHDYILMGVELPTPEEYAGSL